MVLEILSSILDGVALLGIGIEILGFILLIKFLRRPTWTEYKKWLDNIPEHKKTEKFWKNTTIYHDVQKISEEDIASGDNVNIGFLDYWKSRRELGISFVIIGLVFQMMQIIFPYIFQ